MPDVFTVYLKMMMMTTTTTTTTMTMTMMMMMMMMMKKKGGTVTEWLECWTTNKTKRLGFEPSPEHCVVFLGMTLNSHLVPLELRSGL